MFKAKFALLMLLCAAIWCALAILATGCGDGVADPIEPPVVNVGDLDVDLEIPSPLDVRVVGGPVGLYTYEITETRVVLNTRPVFVLYVDVYGTITPTQDITINDIDIDISPLIRTAGAERSTAMRDTKRIWFRNVAEGSTAKFEVMRAFFTDPDIYEGFTIELELDVEVHR